MYRAFKYCLILLFFVQSVTAQNIYIIRELNNRVSDNIHWETGITPVNDSVIYYVTDDPSLGPQKYQDREGRNFSDVFQSTLRNGKWQKGQRLEGVNGKYHDGGAWVAKDETLMVIAKAYESRLNSGLFFYKKENGKWIPDGDFQYNDENFILYTPFLTEDGNDLYFAANFEGSIGGLDIYHSRFENGSWSKPENLGSVVNTAEDELYPFLHPGGRLYFSSKGHDVSSESDIFYTYKYGDSFRKVVRVKFLDNENGMVEHKYAFSISHDFKSGFFSKRSNNGKSDLYKFYINPEEFPDDKEVKQMKRNKWCFRLRENSMDTIDYEVFDYEWVVRSSIDTVHLPGHDVRYCFPGPGSYDMEFNVTNKLLDTVMYGEARLHLDLELHKQAMIGFSKKVAKVGEIIEFRASETYLPQYDIDDYNWNFKDGNFKKGEVVEHAFEYPGKYRIELTVRAKRVERNVDPEMYTVYRTVTIEE